jgi:hypothetical protein
MDWLFLSSSNTSLNSEGYWSQANLLLSIGSVRASNSDPRVAHPDFPVPPTTGMSSLNSVSVLLGVQLKIRDALENGGVRLKIQGDVRRGIAALWKSFRTYTGDG